MNRPQVCPDVVAPVCGCDGTTYGNDCLRRQGGACKLHNGPCIATGGCFDTIAGACTGQACSPAAGCLLPNEFCSPACASPPPTGTCFDTLARKCETESCGPDHPCLPNEFCVATCPPPPPTGRCFVTVDGQCSTESCGPGAPCQNPNEFCAPQCLPATCGTNADCDDGNPCTADQCVGGTCEHACVCVAPTGAAACCPGPGTTCVQPCGPSADGTCGGTCPVGDECGPSATGCACAPGVRLCGDTFPTCNGTCPVGTSCESLTGALACQCVPQGCGGDTGTYFYTCGAPVCSGPLPLQSNVPACTTERVGDPCPCLGVTCDPGDICHRLLECATSDPTHGGMCPISRRAYKTNIEYLSAEDLTRLHDALLKFRLASYQYAIPGASPASHLGFIIDDVAPSPSVAEGGDTVDLYGYASMAVAAVQTQAREIAALQREVESLRAAIKEQGRGGCAVTAIATRRSKRAHPSSSTSEPGHPG